MPLVTHKSLLDAITLVHLPNGPTAYFKLTSIELTKQIYVCLPFASTVGTRLTTIVQGHARATPHHPELVLNGFVTRLGHACGRMFQTAFPQLPEFQGRQVVTLHNQRDFIFFRRHRYGLLDLSYTNTNLYPLGMLSARLRKWPFKKLVRGSL